MEEESGRLSTTLWISCDKRVGLRHQSTHRALGIWSVVRAEREECCVGRPSIEALERWVEPLLSADGARPNVGQIVDGLAADEDAVGPNGARGSPPAGGAIGALLVDTHTGANNAIRLSGA